MADSDNVMLDDETLMTFMTATDASPEQAKNYLQVCPRQR